MRDIFLKYKAQISKLLVALVLVMYLSVLFYVYIDSTRIITNEETYSVAEYDDNKVIFSNSKGDEIILTLESEYRKEKKFSQGFPLYGHYKISFDDQIILGYNAKFSDSYIVKSDGVKESKQYYRFKNHMSTSSISKEMLFASTIEEIYGFLNGYWKLSAISGCILLICLSYMFIKNLKLLEETIHKNSLKAILVSVVIYLLISSFTLLFVIGWMSKFKYW